MVKTFKWFLKGKFMPTFNEYHNILNISVSKGWFLIGSIFDLQIVG